MSKAFVRTRWKQKNNGKWFAEIVTVNQNGYNNIELRKGTRLSFELKKSKKCTGYWNEDFKMIPCPENRTLTKGSQCPECKSKDIYNNYISGEGKSPRNEESHSVYMAQIGSRVKVGVTRTERLEKRWIEQGADYATEIHKDLTSEQALEKEQKISQKHGLKQRISKESKIHSSKNAEKLKKAIKKVHNLDSKIVDVQSKTVYPSTDLREVRRSGLFKGKINTVKGSILTTQKQALAMTEGKIMAKPSQTRIKEH